MSVSFDVKLPLAVDVMGGDNGPGEIVAGAREAIGIGFGGAAGRIIGQVESGDDDRAVLILSRAAVASPKPAS